MLSDMNESVKEVVHIESKTGVAVFNTVRANEVVDLSDCDGVTVALDEIVAAFVAEGLHKIQVKRGSIYTVSIEAWRIIIDRCKLVQCDESMGDYVTPLEICPCRVCVGGVS